MQAIFDHPLELGLLTALVLSAVLDLGRFISIRTHIGEVPQRKEQLGTIRDGMFVLVSLLLGFTLTMAASRFVERRSLVVDEAIALDSAYMRADMLPDPYRQHAKELLREYIDTRLELDGDGTDSARASATLNHSRRLQESLWQDAAAVAKSNPTAITAVYLNALNETIDLHEKRVASFENRIPLPIWYLILAVSLIAVFTRGSTLNSRFWLTLILVPVTIAIVVSLIADLDTPSRGLIRLDQRAMQRLKAQINAGAEK
jgi:Protein of unknown function (DUF4239)